MVEYRGRKGEDGKGRRNPGKSDFNRVRNLRKDWDDYTSENRGKGIGRTKRWGVRRFLDEPQEDGKTGAEYVQEMDAHTKKIVFKLEAVGAIEALLAAITIERLATGFIVAKYDGSKLPKICMVEAVPEVTESADYVLREIGTFHISSKRGQTTRTISDPDKLIVTLEKLGIPLSGELAKNRDEILAAAQKGKDGTAR